MSQSVNHHLQQARQPGQVERRNHRRMEISGPAPKANAVAMRQHGQVAFSLPLRK